MFFVLLEGVCYLLSDQIELCKHLGIKKNFQGSSYLLEKARSKIESDTIHLGDSVARQLFPPQLADNHLTGNATILLSGNYIILKELLIHNPHVTDVYLGQIPAALRCQYEHKNTVNNFIKPFLNFHTSYFKIPEIKDKLLAHPITLKYLSYTYKFAPVSEYNLEIKIPEAEYISDYNLAFLQYISDLCQEYDAKLHLYSPPLSDNREDRLEIYKEVQLSEEYKNLNSLFDSYYHSFKFVEKERFHDAMHLNKHYLHKNRNMLQNYYLSL